MPFFPWQDILRLKRSVPKNYIEELKNKLASALMSLLLFPFSQFLLLPWFLISIAIDYVLSHFSYKSLFKGFLHKAQKQKSFSANSATIHKQFLQRLTQIKLSFRSMVGFFCCICVLFCLRMIFALKLDFIRLKKTVKKVCLNFIFFLLFKI